MNEPNLHDSHVKRFRKRQSFPETAWIVDQLTKSFPEANKPEYISENGKTVGKIKHVINVCSIDGIGYGRMI